MDLGQLKVELKEYKKYSVLVKAWPKDMLEK